MPLKFSVQPNNPTMKTPVKKTNIKLFSVLAAVTLLALSIPSAFAANDTWTGIGGANWSITNNWLGGVAPVANDSLFFDGAVGLNPNNDFAANTVFSSITFNTGAAPFVLSGNVLNLAGNITNNNSLNA